MSAGYGPPAVNTFGMMTSLGDTFGKSYDAARQRAFEDEAPALFGQMMGLGNPSAAAVPVAGPATAAPSRAALPSFASAGGAMGDYLATTRAKESGGDDTAKNPSSTATGRYQFTQGTWNGLAKKYPDLGLTPNGRTDPAQQERAMQAFTDDNAKALTAAGIPINPGNLYVSHFLGEAGGPRFIAGAMSSPDAPATSFVTPGAASANRTIFFNRDGSPKTAGEVYAERTSRYAGGGQTATPALPTARTASAGPVMSVPAVPATPAPTATASADMPETGAQPAGFVIPGQGASAQAAPAAPAAQGFAGFGSPASRITPEQQQILTAAWKNPVTRPMATQIYGQLLKGRESQWQLSTMGDQPVLFNQATAQIVPVGERKADLTSEQKNYQEARKGNPALTFQEHLDAQRRPLTPTLVSPGQTVLPPGEYSAPSFVAAPKTEPFTLKAGETRFEGGQPVASVPDREKSAGDEAKLRQEFTKQLGTFSDVQDGYRRLIAATEQREANPASVSPASDIALVFGYMKMLDPGSVVREGEYATAKNAAGVPVQVMNAYNKAINGEFLAPEQRQDFVDTAGRLYAQARQGAEGVASRYRELAKGQNLDEGRVVALPDALAAPKISQKKADAGSMPEIVRGGRPPNGYTAGSYVAKSKSILSQRPDLKPQLQKMLAESGIDPKRLDQ